MLIHVHFLWDHIDILLAAVILVIVINTLVVTTVVKGFQYNNKTSLLVGMSLAQIGEFAFVLLSRASNVHLVEGKLYLLLLGTTALSLAMFIPSAEALDTSYFMSNYVWNPDDENVGGGSDFDDMTEACSISCSCASCYTQDEDVGYAMSYTYSGEASEEFDRDDNILTFIKPSAMPSKDIRSPLEVGSLHGGNNGVSNDDLEEDKTE